MKFNFLKDDSKVMKVLSKIVDGLLLTIIFSIACIPLFTIGCSFTSFYYASVKVIRRNRGYMFRSFIDSFKLNFKLSTVVWLIQFLIMGICTLGAYVAFTSKGMLGSVVSVILIAIYFAIFVVALTAGPFIYPAISRYKMNLKNALKLALIMVLSHPGKSLLVFFMTVTYIFLMIFSAMNLVILVFIWPELYILGLSMIMEKVLLEYIDSIKNE
ncbi:MAG: YesL family protein [Lachnospiraceae bacterium]|nr:YesL family protein [Lachnospiraceae bacterium]